MKKLSLFILLLCFINLFTQQQETESTRQNDFVLAPVELIGGLLVNVSYERLLNEKSGIGISAIVSINDEVLDQFTQFSPYYRRYFGKNYASGFFIEGFVPITTTKVDLDGYVFGNNNSIISDKETTSIGIGAGIGGKWKLRNNILFETSVGVGTRLNGSNLDAITGKYMFGIGYRF